MGFQPLSPGGRGRDRETHRSLDREPALVSILHRLELYQYLEPTSHSWEHHDPPEFRGLNELIATAKVARDVIQEREESARPRARGEKPLLYLKSQAFAGLRDDSVDKAANYLVGDFQGSGGWKPGKKAYNKK